MCKRDLEADLPLIDCDGAQIEQVLLALLMNAIDAMPQGGNLWLTSTAVPTPTQLRIVVRDDGAGIPPEILPRIFEPFLTTKETGRGVGLGLPSATAFWSAIAERIEVQSELGQWHDVHSDAAVGDSSTESSPRRQEISAVAQREVIEVETQGKLLIVDDELSVRDSLGKWFREEGYDIGTAENASDALTRMAESKWDVALLDIKMRGTDGIELQRRLHELDPELIVIMMTGYASVETAVTALKNGAYDYVSKPLDPDEIAHLVKKALAHGMPKKKTCGCGKPWQKLPARTTWSGRAPAMRKVFDAIETVARPTRTC